MAICLKDGIPVVSVDITAKWVREWLAEYRLSSRRPNRKFKVSRNVLKERLCLFWISVYQVRKLIQFTFGYDPRMRNIDQSPFHRNETDSAGGNTIVVKNAVTVPLLENHKHSR